MFEGGTTLVLVGLVEGDTTRGLEVLGEVHRYHTSTSSSTG